MGSLKKTLIAGDARNKEIYKTILTTILNKNGIIVNTIYVYFTYQGIRKTAINN